MTYKRSYLKTALHILLFLTIFLTIISPIVKPTNKPNILLIVVDTLRADHLGYNGYEKNTSPNIDLFSKECMVFKNAYSQSGWTFPSFCTIFTSLHPREHGAVTWDTKLNQEIITLPEVLQENGYTTYGYPSLFRLNKESGIAQGFDHFRKGVIELGNPVVVTSSQKVNELIINDLDSIQQPFFIWAHYFDPHNNYNYYPEFGFGVSDIGKYDGEIAYTDRYIGNLLDELKRRGLYDDMTIIFTADHGEEFWEHGGNFHHCLYDEVLKIPLLIKTPKSQHTGNHDIYVDQLDIATTILSLAGIENPDQFTGRNLINPEIEYRPVFSEMRIPKYPFQKAIIHDGHKYYQLRGDPNKKYAERFKNYDNQLYNLLEDPNEENNIFSDWNLVNDRITELEYRMTDFYRKPIPYYSSEDLLDEKTIIKLKSLGYIVE
ncbi:MAG: sulfatase [candidate division Zixibacteria bacterium]|nr:sulfatase [candidate division Zixibacteria bacterium]